MPNDNSAILLGKALALLGSHAKEFIRVNDAGTDFDYSDIDDIVTAINALSDPLLDIQKIDGKSIEDFIEYIGEEIGSHDHSNKTVLNDITTELVTAWSAKQNALGFTPEDSANKGVANGYVPLNASGLISTSFFPPAYLNKDQFRVVDTLAARDLLTDLHLATVVFVKDVDPENAGEQHNLFILLDNTPDAYVWKGYTVVHSGSLVATWAQLANAPSSSPDDIDDMVDKSHAHANKTVLDKFTFDSTLSTLKYDSKIVGLGTSGIKIYSAFTQTLAASGSTAVLDSNYDSDVDNLWHIHFLGLKLTPTKHFTFNKASKTVTLLNGLQFLAGATIDIVKFSYGSV
jgi:hypothetical protein